MKSFLYCLLALAVFFEGVAHAQPITKIITAAPRAEKWKGWGKYSEPDPEGPGNLTPADKFTRYKVEQGQPRIFSGRVEGLTDFAGAKVGLVSLTGVWWNDEDAYQWAPVQPDGVFSIEATKYLEAEKALCLRAPGHPWTVLHANFPKGEAAKDVVLRAMPGKTVRIAVRFADGTAPRWTVVEPFEAYRSYDSSRQPLAKQRYGRFTAEDDEISVILPLEPVALYVGGSGAASCYAIVDPNEADRYEFVLLPAATLKGTFSRAGKPVTNAEINLYNENEPLSVRGQRTDAEGKWRQGGLPPGDWEIWGAGLDQHIIVAAGQTAELNTDAAAPGGEKVVPATTYFYAKKRVKLSEVGTAAGELIDPLYNALKAAGLESTGPLEFHYIDCDGIEDHPFELQIAVPIKEIKPIKEGYFIKESPPFRCLSMAYKGPMKGIPNAWDTVMKKADQAKLEPGTEGREVYLKFTTPEAEDNETEIQMGLKP